MKVRNVSGVDREVAPADHPPFDVAAGEIVDVPDELGASLCEQAGVWARVTKKGED